MGLINYFVENLGHHFWTWNPSKSSKVPNYSGFSL